MNLRAFPYEALHLVLDLLFRNTIVAERARSFAALSAPHPQRRRTGKAPIVGDSERLTTPPCHRWGRYAHRGSSIASWSGTELQSRTT
jgi:hypothetical protein